MLNAKTKMTLSMQLLTNFLWVHIWLFIWLHFVGAPFVAGCKSCNSRVEKEKRLWIVHGQILAKLGMAQPPSEENIVNVSRDAMQTYKSAVQEKDKLYLESKSCRSQAEAIEEYFAKRVERLTLEKEFARTVKTSSEEIIDVYELRFNISKLVVDSGARVSLAELRVYQTPNKLQSQNGVRIEVCENNRESFNNNTQYGCFNALDSEWSLSNEKRWVSLDVTTVVQKWLNDLKTNHGLTVTVTSSVGIEQHSHFSPIYLGEAGDKNVGDEVEEPWPNILVWFVPRERVESTSRRRNRRSLDWRYCKKRPRESRCCLRSLFIDFEKDLRWKWIHAPKGFYANYCAGRCPFLWGSEKQHHHTSIMALYNRINPNAPGDPCCVPKAYEPLVILYFKEGQPKVDELSNMAVSECTCL